MTTKKPEDLRSHRWFGVQDMRSSGHRSRTMQMGYAKEDFVGKPIIAIVNTWSDLNPCHMHFRMRAEEVKRGVWQAIGLGGMFASSGTDGNTEKNRRADLASGAG